MVSFKGLFAELIFIFYLEENLVVKKMGLFAVSYISFSLFS